MNDFFCLSINNHLQWFIWLGERHQNEVAIIFTAYLLLANLSVLYHEISKVSFLISSELLRLYVH